VTILGEIFSKHVTNFDSYYFKIIETVIIKFQIYKLTSQKAVNTLSQNHRKEKEIKRSNGLIFSFSWCVLRYVDELLYWSGKRMKFDEYLQNEISPKRLPSTWVTNTKFVYQSDDGSLAILDTANDSVATLVTNHTLVSFFLIFSSFFCLWNENLWLTWKLP